MKIVTASLFALVLLAPVAATADVGGGVSVLGVGAGAHVGSAEAGLGVREHRCSWHHHRRYCA